MRPVCIRLLCFLKGYPNFLLGSEIRIWSLLLKDANPLSTKKVVLGTDFYLISGLFFSPERNVFIEVNLASLGAEEVGKLW